LADLLADSWAVPKDASKADLSVDHWPDEFLYGIYEKKMYN